MPLNPPTRERLIESTVVLGVLGFSVLQLKLGGGFGDFPEVSTDPDALAYALASLSALALLWRHNHPWVVFLVTLALSLLLAGLGNGVHAPLAPAVALYEIALVSERNRTWAVVGTAIAGWFGLVVIEMSVTPYGAPDYLLPGTIWAGAWLLGDRRRSQRTRMSDRLANARREQELAVAEERTRIARELHDSAGHALNTILVQAGAARVLREQDDDRAAKAVAAIEELARETIEEIDRIVGLLREDREMDRSPLPGIDQIAGLVERQRASGLDVQFTVGGDSDRSPPADVSRAVYRIAQESLTNASRHGTGAATIGIEIGPDELAISVANPVSVQNASPHRGGRGLAGMRERAQLLGGTLDARQMGTRFQLKARLPYDRAQR